MKNKKCLIYNLAPLIAVLIIITVWSIASKIIDSELILPSFIDALKSAIELLKEKTFYIYFLNTLLRSLISFALSFFIAFTLAYFSFKNKTAERFISPVISIMRALPTVAVVLLLLLWTSNSVAPVIVTMLVVLPTIYTNAINSYSVIDKNEIRALEVFNVPKKEVFFKVKLPQILPQIYLAVGSGLSLNLKLMVAAEVLSSTAKSVGYLLNTSKVYFEVPKMFALVLITVVIGVIIESAFSIISKKAGKWL